jgi:hypothetical protein
MQPLYRCNSSQRLALKADIEDAPKSGPEYLLHTVHPLLR